MSSWKQALLCVVLVALAAGGWYLLENPQAIGLARESSAGEGGPAGSGGASGRNRIPGLTGAGGAVNVIAAPVEADQGGETVMALGTVKAARSVTLYPQVMGIVTEILFTPGRPVTAGAPLLRLEDDEQKIAMDRARVTLQQAKGTLARSEALSKSKTISNVTLSDAETAVQLAEIEVHAAEVALGRRTIEAPFAGVTGLTDLSVGDLVTNSTAITTLDDLATVHVRFEVPERWAGHIAEGRAITATAQGMPGSQFGGNVSAVDNRVDETTRTLRLEAELANPDQALKPGMAISVALQFDTSERLAVPALAVQWDRRGPFVWKLADGAARRANVAIVRRESGIVIVGGDVRSGDRVVVEGVQRLREGAKVAEVGEAPKLAEDAEIEQRGAPVKAPTPTADPAGRAADARS